MRALIIGAGLLILGACATTGPSQYSQELETLEASCRERGGILSPSGSPTSARPSTDYTCEIHGGASGRLPPRND